MKKFISLALAAMMLLSMSAVAFAATEDAKVAGFAKTWAEFNQITDSVTEAAFGAEEFSIHRMDASLPVMDGEEPAMYPAIGSAMWVLPGDSILFPLIFEAKTQGDDTYEITTKSVTGLNVRTSFYDGGDKVDSVKVIKAKFGEDKFAYALELKTVANPTYGSSDTIDGDITLFQNGWDGHERSNDAYILEITDLKYGYPEGDFGILTDEQERFEFDSTVRLPGTMFYFDTATVGFDGWLEFDGTTIAKNTLGYANSAWNQDIAMEYAMYNLDFLNIFFNATKDITANLMMDEDAVLYMINADGMLEMVKGEWDNDYYVFDAPRAMEGVTYVISYDGELPIAEVTPEPTPEVEDEKDNVATGASL